MPLSYHRENRSNRFGARDYDAVSGEVESVAWLVIFDERGILETTVPPRDLRAYWMQYGFVRLGRVREITHA